LWRGATSAGCHLSREPPQHTFHSEAGKGRMHLRCWVAQRGQPQLSCHEPLHHLGPDTAQVSAVGPGWQPCMCAQAGHRFNLSCRVSVHLRGESRCIAPTADVREYRGGACESCRRLLTHRRGRRSRRAGCRPGRCCMGMLTVHQRPLLSLLRGQSACSGCIPHTDLRSWQVSPAPAEVLVQQLRAVVLLCCVPDHAMNMAGVCGVGWMPPFRADF